MSAPAGREAHPGHAAGEGRHQLDQYAFYVSRLFSQAGQGLFFGVLAVVAGGAPQAALGVSSVLVAMAAGSLLFGAPGGMLVDRIGTPQALVLGAGLRLLAILSAFLIVEGPASAAVAAFLYSAASQVFSPSELALVQWVAPRRAGRTHTVLVALQYGGQALGALTLAPLLYALAGTSAMVAGAILAYVIVIAVGIQLVIFLQGVPTPAPGAVAFAWGEVISYVRLDRRATYAVGLITFAEVATKALAVTVPFFLFEQLDLSPSQLGAVVVLGVAGAGTGLSWAGRWFQLRLAERTMRLTLLAATIALFSLGALGWTVVALAGLTGVGWIEGVVGWLNPEYLLVLPLTAVLGVCFSVSRIAPRTVLSETAPPHAQGKIFAVLTALGDSLVVVLLIAVGVIVAYAGPRAALLLIAGLGAGVFILLEQSFLRPAPQAGACARTSGMRAAAPPSSGIEDRRA